MASPYRVAGRPPPIAFAFGGPDDARIPIVLWLLLLIPLVPFCSRVGLRGSLVAAILVVSGVLLHLADRKSRRYSLTISKEGMTLRRYRFFVLRTATFRASLEWEPTLTDEWDDFDPAGFSFSPPKRLCLVRHTGLPTSPTFGPIRETEKERALLDGMKRALAHHRANVAREDIGREHKRGSGDLRKLWDRADPNRLEYGPWGRVSSLVLARKAKLGDFVLPLGTKVEFGHAEHFQAPSTKDLVTRVTLGAPMFVDALQLRVTAGARITLDERRLPSQIERAFVRNTVVQGVLVDGKGTMSIDARGRITGCILGAPLAIGGLHFPAGTKVNLYYNYHIAFQGSGIRVDGEPGVHPASVRVTLTSWGRRSALAAILKDPKRRIAAEAHLCMHPAGAAAGPKDHRAVSLWS